MPPEYPNGVITRYSVHYDGKYIEEFGNVTDNLIDTIKGLAPNTVYTLEMKAYTRVGAGPPVCLPVKTRKLIVSVGLYCTLRFFLLTIKC